MKRLKAAMCAVLAGLMLAGCGSKEVITCRGQRTRQRRWI